MICICKTVKRSQYEQFDDQTTTIEKGILGELFFFNTKCVNCLVKVDNYYQYIFVRNKIRMLIQLRIVICKV